MNHTKGSVLLVVVIAVTVSSLYAQQRRKGSATSSKPAQSVPVPSGGELVSKANHQKARAAAQAFWDARFIKCGADKWYTLFLTNHIVEVYEIRETPQVSYIPLMLVRSKVDIMNNLEAFGITTLSSIMREYSEVENTGVLGAGAFRNKEWKLHVTITNGLTTLNSKLGFIDGNPASYVDPSTVVYLDSFYLPHSCEDVENYIRNKKVFPAKLFACRITGSQDCGNRKVGQATRDREFLYGSPPAPKTTPRLSAN